VRQLDRARDAGAEPDAVVRSRHVVVHRLGDGHDLYALTMEAAGIAERVIATDRDQVVYAQEFQVPQYGRGDVVDVPCILVLQVVRKQSSGKGAGTCPRRMKEGSTRSPRAGHDLAGQFLVEVAVVRSLLRNDVHQTSPTSANTDDTVAFVDGSYRDRPNRRIQPRNISSTCQNADGTL